MGLGGVPARFADGGPPSAGASVDRPSSMAAVFGVQRRAEFENRVLSPRQTKKGGKEEEKVPSRCAALSERWSTGSEGVDTSIKGLLGRAEREAQVLSELDGTAMQTFAHDRSGFHNAMLDQWPTRAPTFRITYVH